MKRNYRYKMDFITFAILFLSVTCSYAWEVLDTGADSVTVLCHSNEEPNERGLLIKCFPATKEIVLGYMDTEANHLVDGKNTLIFDFKGDSDTPYGVHATSTYHGQILVATSLVNHTLQKLKTGNLAAVAAVEKDGIKPTVSTFDLAGSAAAINKVLNACK